MNPSIDHAFDLATDLRILVIGSLLVLAACVALERGVDWFVREWLG